MAPEGVAMPAPKPRRDETLVKALVRAHRWIETGRARSITDLAEQEGVTDLCRLLPLICLALNIVEAILHGRQPRGLRLAELLGNGPLGWDAQRAKWASPIDIDVFRKPYDCDYRSRACDLPGIARSVRLHRYFKG
jgi:hypothetical protein